MTAREIEAKSVLRRFRRIDSWFVAKSGLNLYRGCAHDCAYCDGRAEKYRVEGLAAAATGTASFSEVAIKVNAVEVLRRELVPKRRTTAPRWSGFVVLGGGVGDSYQPAEESCGIARRTLVLFEELGVPVHILTKSTLVLRDADILERIAGDGRTGARRTGALVSFSISSADDATSSIFEPGAPPPSQRLRALAALAKRGIPGGVFLMPVIPGVTDSREAMDAALAAAVDAGARYVLFGGMTLKDGRQKDHFLSVLSGVRPDLVPSYRRLYPGDPWGGASGDYYARITRIFGDLARGRRIPPRIPRELFEGIVSGADLAVTLLDQTHAMLELEGKRSRLGYAAFQLSREKGAAASSGIDPQAAAMVEEIRRTGTARLYEQLLSRFSRGA
jgi:DNA repair photolyase